MMLSPIKISVMLFALLPSFLLAQSAHETTATETALEIQITADELPPPQLQQFHFRAKEKMEDFSDILTMLGNEEIEIGLRQEVFKAAFDFFLSEKTPMQWYDLKSKKIIELPIDELMNERMTQHDNLTIQFSNLTGAPPLSCPPPNCSWQLDFQILQTPGTGNTVSSNASMTIVLEKKEKFFGQVKKEVWEVFLGEIIILPVRP